MAKGSNPADAHRKALRKKELKRNKEDRKKTREIQTVKKDTRSLEADIKKLADAAQKGPLSAGDREQLSSLRSELTRIQKAKTTYVEAHPEHRKFVFPERKEGTSSAETSGASETGLYTKDGKLRHPERSLYYDPVFNPFGAPPPGMPYRERPPTAEELAAFAPSIDSASLLETGSSSSDEEDEDDIALPEGPPPDIATNTSEDSSSDSELDDIPMPDGAPPASVHTLPAKPAPMIARPAGGPPPRHFPQPFHPDPHMRHALPYDRQQPYPRRRPPPDLNDPMAAGLPPRPNFPPPGAIAQYHAPPQNTSPSLASVNSLSVPESSGGPFLAFPTAIPVGGSASATISAAPQLRDLKKEATAFVPTAIRKKKPAVTHVNAAPGAERGTAGEARASLRDAMSDAGVGVAKVEVKDQGKEDYERFQQQMKAFL